jgi:NAD-dependent dihydropyrimidine dehydrogenase PreA subunit/flavodoxin
MEETMSLIHSLLRRRQFLFAFLSSIITAIMSLVYWRSSRAFDLLFRTGTAAASETPAAGDKKTPRGIVVYYSATGNTAQVAEAIWRGMSSVIPCDVAPVNKLKPIDMAKYDVMAIGAPNWYMRVPVNITIFTHDMPRMDGKHCIIFGTHGGMPWGQFWFLSKNILKKGMNIIGWSDWYGADFLTPHSCIPDGEWGHPDKIDLAEAEAFGRQMAFNSKRIYAGETGLVPDRIPTPDIGSGSLWAPNSDGNGKIAFAGGGRNATPHFDFMKCVYPRCNRCIENCPVQGIDFSVVASAGVLAGEAPTASPIVLKEACHECGGVCERFCLYDAIEYRADDGEKARPKIDMTTCTYPKCTVCADECPQDAIDLTKNPPVIHNWCEGESLCFGLCPENAIVATSTSVGPGGGADEGRGPMSGGPGGGPMGEGRGPMAGGPPGGGMPPDGGMPGGTGGPGGPGGPGASGLMMAAMGGYTPRFRPLVTEECTGGKVGDLTTYPRIPLNKKLWPYHMEES